MKIKKGNVGKYLENVDDVFGIMKKSIDDKSMHRLLKGPIAHEGFRRLT